MLQTRRCSLGKAPPAQKKLCPVSLIDFAFKFLDLVCSLTVRKQKIVHYRSAGGSGEFEAGKSAQTLQRQDFTPAAAGPRAAARGGVMVHNTVFCGLLGRLPAEALQISSALLNCQNSALQPAASSSCCSRPGSYRGSGDAGFQSAAPPSRSHDQADGGHNRGSP